MPLRLSIRVAVLLGCTILFVYFQDVKAERKLIEARERSIISIGSATLTLDFKSIVSDLMILSDLVEFHPGIFNGSAESRNMITKGFLSFSIRHQSFDQIRYLNENGKEVIRINFNNGKPSQVE